MRQLKSVLIASIIFGFSPVTLAKKHCDPLLEKLHHIQSLQRIPYSVKEGISLRKREDTARKRWWQCEKGSSKKKIKQTKKVTKNKNSTLSSKLNDASEIKNKGANVATSFKSSNAIIIKSKYQGDKQQAWLKYYQQPDKCIKPKSLPAFAACIENKQAQRESFENQYNNQ
ncbi:hypothetical protein [Colwellia sp. 20A7]|uniref:hypothetical protein n=1 Tax=Colwellia sp. 20A7 TaxID=2689569 RepID=UPI001F326649|nr:hypothetical protein [Colwellia sp. 20A7]